MEKPEYREIEIKVAADSVTKESFVEYVKMAYPGAKMKEVTGIDVYFRNDQGHVIRFRDSVDYKELTVKKRSSRHNTLNRLEIDLKIEKASNFNDVVAFINSLGFSRQMTVIKDTLIFDVEELGNEQTPKKAEYDKWYTPHFGIVPGTIVLYNAYSINPQGIQSKNYRFIEIEVDKAHSFDEYATNAIDKALLELRDGLADGIDEPINQSLYEFFTGDSYMLEGDEYVEE